MCIRDRKKVLNDVRDIQLMAKKCGSKEYMRQAEQAAVKARKPWLLLVPTHGEPASMFEPLTLAMALPDLFVYGDLVPFLLREANMNFLEWVQMLLAREELAYDLPDEEPGSYQPPQPSRWRQSPVFVPIAYDMQRRLNLMRASKAHVKRGGFQQDCKEIAKLTPEQLLQAIAKLGEGADFRSIIHDEKVPEPVRKAVKALVLCTGAVIGTEGHRTKIRHQIHAYGTHFGQSQIFITPNLADNRLALLVELHTGPKDYNRDAEDVESRVERYRLDLLEEKPEMPTGAEMMRILASDSVAQARVFHLMITLFFEIILGTTPPLEKEYLPAKRTNKFEDGFAASGLGGCFGDVASAIGPVETQGRGSQHPQTLVTLIGQALVAE